MGYDEHYAAVRAQLAGQRDLDDFDDDYDDDDDGDDGESDDDDVAVNALRVIHALAAAHSGVLCSPDNC